MPGSGVSGDEWVPEFAGQRPPFAVSNSAAVTHGARSERRLAPLAEAHVAALLAEPESPGYLRDPSFSRALVAYGRAEAMCDLLWEWLAAQDVEAALTEVTQPAETEDRDTAKDGSGRVTRKSMSRRTASVWDQLQKAQKVADRLRSELGLAPRPRMGIVRDAGVAAAKVDEALELMAARGREIAERRAAELMAGPAVAGEVIGGDAA